MAEKSGASEPLEEKKKFRKEDISSAKDVGGTLEAYRRASENSSCYSDLVDLRIAVADRMHELGDEDKSAEFTILAGQTQNAERIDQTIRMFGEIASGFGNDAGRLRGSLEGFDRSSGKIGEAMDELRIESSRIAGAASQIGGAAEKISDASHTMNRAAGTIHEASMRTGR